MLNFMFLCKQAESVEGSRVETATIDLLPDPLNNIYDYILGANDYKPRFVYIQHRTTKLKKMLLV